MHPDYAEILARRFSVPLPESGPDKRLALGEAIARFVRPGMRLHLGSTHNRPCGLVHELMRRYWGKAPGFEVSCINLGETLVGLYVGRMLSRGITTYVGDIWPYPSPNPVFSRMWKRGEAPIEHWGILSMTQRLLAGAMGLPFVPSRSVGGSTMAGDNAAAGTYAEIDDPFGSGERVGLVRALNPHVTFLHVPACDVAGNAIITPPAGEGALGVFAATEGTILSTEKIVSTDYLRRHSHLVKVPAHKVLAVVELPFGGHPRGQTNVGIPEMPRYADDYAFLNAVRLAAREGEQALEQWFREWVLEVADQQAFLEKLGRERALRIRGKAQGEAWIEEIAGAAAGDVGENGRGGELPEESEPLVPSEQMIVAAARKMTALAVELGAKHLLAGVGAANLAAWLAREWLADRGCAVEVMAEVGYFGYAPRPSDPYIFNFKNTPTCIATTDILSVLGMLVPDGENLGSLGAAQVDRFGNVNSTAIPQKRHFLGSGGGNDVASGAKAVVVTAYLGREKFPERVDYVTSPGRNVRLVVTDRGVFAKQPGESAELVLTAWYRGGPFGYAGEREAVADIRANVGWDLRVADVLEPIDPPEKEELYVLRLFDPWRQFLR